MSQDTTKTAPGELSCAEGKLLLRRILSDDPSIAECEEDAFALHVSNCAECACAFYLAEGFNENGSMTPGEITLLWSDVITSLRKVRAKQTVFEYPQKYVARRCSDLASAHAKAVRRRIVFRAVRIAVGLLLLIAAGLKGYQLATEPIPGTGLLNARWFLIAVVEIELFLGAWMLSGVQPRWSWLASLICFAAFAVVSAYKAFGGEASCGCFGQVPVKPVYTLLLDIAVVILLIVFRPASQSSADKGHRWHSAAMAVVFAITVVFGAWSARAMAQYTPPVLQAQQDHWPPNQLVVLEPKKWIGQPCPLLRYIDVGDQLKVGKWKVVLYHYDCSECQAAVPKFEAMSRDPVTAGGTKIALIAMPPFAAPGQDLPSPDSPCLLGRLTADRDWFAQTPVVLDLDSEKVFAATTGESN